LSFLGTALVFITSSIRESSLAIFSGTVSFTIEERGVGDCKRLSLPLAAENYREHKKDMVNTFFIAHE
jgi:hypothetical protein